MRFPVLSLAFKQGRLVPVGSTVRASTPNAIQKHRSNSEISKTVLKYLSDPKIVSNLLNQADDPNAVKTFLRQLGIPRLVRIIPQALPPEWNAAFANQAPPVPTPLLTSEVLDALSLVLQLERGGGVKGEKGAAGLKGKAGMESA